MHYPDFIQAKIFDIHGLVQHRNAWKLTGKTVVFTNGCFDILHKGHVDYLNAARNFGEVLIVGLNSDDSVRRLKGEDRPVNPLEARLQVLASLQAVSAVIPFEEDTPIQVIGSLKPDVLVKGSDYKPEDIVGGKEVQSWGGRVETIELTQGFSTSSILKKRK